MVEGQPSTNLRQIFVFPFQQGKHHSGKLTSQHYQHLSCAISPCPLGLIKLFPCFCPTSGHRSVVQQAPSF